MPAATGPPGPLGQERRHLGHHVVVVRVGVGHPGGQADVGGHHRRPGPSRRGEVVGVGEPADVVAHHRARLVGGGGHRGPPRVDRDRHVEPPRHRLDGRDDPVELLGLGHLGPGPGLDPAHVEDVGPLGHQLLGPRQERVEAVGGALVVEGVGRPVQDAHDQGPVPDVVACGPRGRGGPHGRRRPRPAPRAPSRSHRIRRGGRPAPCGSGPSAGRRGPGSPGRRGTPGGPPRRRAPARAAGRAGARHVVAHRDVLAGQAGPGRQRPELGGLGDAGHELQGLVRLPPVDEERGQCRPPRRGGPARARGPGAAMPRRPPPPAGRPRWRRGPGAATNSVTWASGTAPMKPSTTLPVAHGEDRRDRLHLEGGRDLGVLVDVDLGQFDGACGGGHHTLEDGAEGLARPAPGRPEVDDDRHGGRADEDVLLEGGVGDVGHDPRP